MTRNAEVSAVRWESTPLSRLEVHNEFMYRGLNNGVSEGEVRGRDSSCASDQDRISDAHQSGKQCGENTWLQL